MGSSTAEIAPYSTFDRVFDRLSDLRARAFGPPAVPTLMHITHAKAGSTWVSELLARLFGSRCAPRGELVAERGEIDRHIFEAGRVYRAMFLTREAFMAHPELHECRRFVVLRDLRDTLISNYFSVKVSHATEGNLRNMDLLLQRRELLQSLSEEDGLLHMLENVTPKTAALQKSWVGQGEIVVRYEEMLLDPRRFFQELLLERLRMPVSPVALDRAIRRTHFQTVYRRRLGEEDVQSHGRRGLPGDWRNHFTPAVRRQFGERYAALLVQTGHEPDDRWITEA
jgi:lipopolysaccharide transport system ATP-binding protein